jgi:hypothetical protein
MLVNLLMDGRENYLFFCIERIDGTDMLAVLAPCMHVSIHAPSYLVQFLYFLHSQLPVLRLEKRQHS